MALSTSLSLILSALTLWTSTRLIPIHPSLASPLPTDRNPPLVSQNASQEQLREYNISNEHSPESKNTSEQRSPGNRDFFLDIPVVRSTKAPSYETGSVRLLSNFLEENNGNSSSVLDEHKLASSDKQESSVKNPCDKEDEGCGTKSADDASDTELTISLFNVSSGEKEEIPAVDEHDISNDERKLKPNLTDYNILSSTPIVSNMLHTTQLMNETSTSTVLMMVMKTTEQTTALDMTTLTNALKSTETTTPTKTTMTTTTAAATTTTTTIPQHSTGKSLKPPPRKVKGHATKVKEHNGGEGEKEGGKKSKNGGHSKSSMSSAPTHHLAKHFTGFVQHVWLPNSTPRPAGPLDDGPFGSILWKDKKYLVSVLIPIGVGFAGAMMIIVMAYASRAWRKRKERLALAQGLPGSFLEAASSKNDDMAPLHESSDDEF